MSEKPADENCGCLIEGVVIKRLAQFSDKRGWLSEFYRTDEINHTPAMGYLSVTEPGLARGPHEHSYQTDLFVFFGEGLFDVYLYDARPESPTSGESFKSQFGGESSVSLLVPPRVIHAYRCVSDVPGTILNLPDKLYAGVGKGEAVDEIRHEDDPESPFFKTFDHALFMND